jgi:hypothetical protein
MLKVRQQSHRGAAAGVDCPLGALAPLIAYQSWALRRAVRSHALIAAEPVGVTAHILDDFAAGVIGFGACGGPRADHHIDAY